MSQFYGTVDAVLLHTGIKREAFGLERDEDLRDLIEGWLVEIKDFIDRDRRKDFSQMEAVPPTVGHISVRMAANMVRAVARNRTRSVVQVDADEGELPLNDAKIFTEAIRKDLMRIPRVSAIEFAVIGKEDATESEE